MYIENVLNEIKVKMGLDGVYLLNRQAWKLM